MKPWSLKPLAHFCQEIEDRCGERNLPVFSVSKNHGIILQVERFKKRIASANTSRYKVVRPGDFVFDPMLLWSGSISRNMTDLVGIVSPAYCVFEVTNSLNPHFLYHYLKQPERLPYYDSISFGTNERRRKAHYLDFVRLQIPVPAAGEQSRIVKLLHEAGELAKLRDTATYRTNALQSALFRKLFGDPEHTSFPVKPLAELVQPERPITYGILKPGPDTDGGIPYVRVLDIKRSRLRAEQLLKTTTEIARQYRRSMLLPGDILITIRGTVGRTCIVPDDLIGANITQDTARLATVSEVESRYVVEFLNTTWAQSWMGQRTLGQTVKGLNLGDLRKLPVPIPPLPMQKQFAAQASQIHELEAHQAASKLRVDALFQSIRYKAFRGEL